MNSEKDNEVYAYFCIDDFPCDPDEITKRMGLVPTKFWRKGDIHPKSRLEKKCNRWMLYSRISRSEDLENHVKDILNQLDSHRDAILSICAEYEVYLQHVGYFHQFYPGFHLDRGDTIRIGEYRLSLDCDFYYLYSDQREGTE